MKIFLAWLKNMVLIGAGICLIGAASGFIFHLLGFDL